MKIPKPCYKEHQTISRVLFVYSMKCRQSSSDNNFTINIICWPLIDPWGKNKILKPYCTSAKHTQSDPIIQFGCDFRCRRSSSDKKFFGRTYGRTDRGNNNIPELSSESAGIKIYNSRTSGHLNPTWDKASVGEENASLFK